MPSEETIRAGLDHVDKQFVPASESGERTVNNAVRHQTICGPVSDAEKRESMVTHGLRTKG